MRITKPADLARLVKKTRQEHGLTQQELADAVGIARQSLARIERGNGGVSFDTVLDIFSHLGIGLRGTRRDADHPASDSPDAVTRGQAFVDQVLARSGHLRVADLRAAIDAGDPDNRLVRRRP